MKKRLLILFALFCAVAALYAFVFLPKTLSGGQDAGGSVGEAASVARNTKASRPKYIILFIGDGMSTPQRMIADEFSRRAGHGQLTLNTLPYHATTRTCSASSLVTDSAAAATAIACGEKTNNGRIGMDAAGVRKLESVAEVAKQKGKKVGIVTTVTINHATPAGFYGHRKSRSEGYALGLDLVASGFDYFAGGGVAGSDDKKVPEYKGKSIYALAEEAGYTLTVGREALLALKPGRKVFARAEDNDKVMPYAIDGGEGLPTLAEFTAKGIELLDNPNGFFMMIEGGKIDYAGHANDAATNLREVLGLDQAVRVALAFAAKHPDETLVVVTGDHETGGMAMGFAGTGYALYMDRLANQKCSVDAFAKMEKKALTEKPELTFEEFKPVLTEKFGFLFDGKEAMSLKAAEIKELEQAFLSDAQTAKQPKWSSKLALTAKKLMSAKAGVGWSSGAHTALPVLTTSQGVGAESFTGFLDNTDLAKKLKSLL